MCPSRDRASEIGDKVCSAPHAAGTVSETVSAAFISDMRSQCVMDGGRTQYTQATQLTGQQTSETRDTLTDSRYTPPDHARDTHVRDTRLARAGALRIIYGDLYGEDQSTVARAPCVTVTVV